MQNQNQKEVATLRPVPTIEKHIQTILLTVITVSIIGGFNKITAISESLVRIEERDKAREVYVQQLQKSVNDIQYEIGQMKNRLTIIESTKQSDRRGK